MKISIHTEFSHPNEAQNWTIECKEDSSDGGMAENIVARFSVPRDQTQNLETVMKAGTRAISKVIREGHEPESERIGNAPWH